MFNHKTTVDRGLKILAEVRPITLRISGDCMNPLVKDGAVVQVSRCGFYWPGDILVFRSQNSQLLVHRLLGFYFRNGSIHYLTKADAAVCPDTSVTKQHIIGKLVGGCSDSKTGRVSIAQRVLALSNFVRFALLRVVTAR